MDPKIKQDPNGICSLNSFLNKTYKAIPNIEPKRRIIEREKGPNIEPKPPNKIKSPPPIPFFLYIFLNKQLINHKDI